MNTNSISNFPYNKSQNQKKISPFIDEGVFLNFKPQADPNYSIENFDYIRDYNNDLITIGKGGYGKIYLAKNKNDNKEYAIKYISKKKMQSMGLDPSVVKREIDIHIRITHPHIIKLYSYLDDRNNYYLALEYAANGSLYQYIQKKKGMSESEAFYYFIQVASAIQFLHSNGYAHRDIKPENILIDENGNIKLCDFGWCVNVSKGERITFCGTYEYMAPEMINDEFYDMGIDIWSLGVLLYEMIHGYSPFRAHYCVKDAKSAMTEIFMNIKSNNYTINKNISEECIDLIDKLLTIDPKKRIKIDELFIHPWVVNKEKEYFPNSIRKNQSINDDINNNAYSEREKDIKYIKDNNTILANQSNDQDIYDQNIIENNEINKDLNNCQNSLKNKSYCFVTSKSLSNNNAIYFIKGSSNKQGREERQNKKEKDNDMNYYDFKNGIINRIKNERNILSPKIVKKELDSKNNFIVKINPKKKTINLPLVKKIEKKNTNTNTRIITPNLYESQEFNNIKQIHINIREKLSSKKSEERNYSKNKNDEKPLIRVQRPDLDDYLKNQKELEDLNQKMKKIKEQQEITINKLKKIEEKKKREESLRKMIDSQKSNTSYDYYSKNKSLKKQFSYINKMPKREIGSYIMKYLKKENANKNINLTEKRSKSFQQLFNRNLLECKIRSLVKESKSKNKIKKLNNLNNENSNHKNLKINKEEELSPKEKFKRFQKKVIHLIKRNKFITRTEDNSYKSYTLDKNLNLNYNKKKKLNYQPTYFKPNKSIQNIFYNTFYNCLFENNQNNFSNSNSKSKNIIVQKSNILKNRRDIKSVSAEKDIYKSISKFNANSKKNKKIFSNNLNINKINKGNFMTNFSTERKVENKYINQTEYNNENKNKNEKKVLNSIRFNGRYNIPNSCNIRSLSNKNDIDNLYNRGEIKLPINNN